jgi:hypothetical protein
LAEGFGVGFIVCFSVTFFFSMSTPISTLRAPVRCLLGDLSDEDSEQSFKDSAIDRGLNTAILFGRLNNPLTTYVTDGTTISPDVTDPKSVLLLCAHVALMFIQAQPDRMSLRTRAFSQSVGSYRDLAKTLERMVREIEGNGMIESFRSFEMWLTDVNPNFAEWWERWRSGESWFGSSF